MSDSSKISTPDGPGTRLDWPAGTSKYFKERRGDGWEQTSEPVEVTPVLLDTGEVRFYSDRALS